GLPGEGLVDPPVPRPCPPADRRGYRPARRLAPRHDRPDAAGLGVASPLELGGSTLRANADARADAGRDCLYRVWEPFGVSYQQDDDTYPPRGDWARWDGGLTAFKMA